MTLEEYMKLRNGLGKGGSAVFAMSRREFEYLGIVESSGWAKRNKYMELSEVDVQFLSSVAKDNKESRGLSSKKISVNFKKETDNTYVYLMKNSHGIHKIGMSNNPKKRAKSLSTASGFPVKLIAFWKVEILARDVEKTLHEKFKSYRTLGEWFDFKGCPDIKSMVEDSIPCGFIRQ